ncbi:hypothetical protein [Chengkuizengella axinellae]|uniref:Uncharacterized protein n=1 Tax=Chengkuizengella axinellae TaxID=3064388 RepID=A0ABT9ITZ1_9BACL|nr:hypothetical protein [Chengkuizengella sp. 2205SS18-9]MDP5272816.1 hypothetical protein [Chengkuizengella sp. 2205SS18-9]
MGLFKETFMESDDFNTPQASFDTVPADAILLEQDDPTIILTVEVCVKHPHNTTIKLDSMIELFVQFSEDLSEKIFVVSYELLKNDVPIRRMLPETEFGVAGQLVIHKSFPNLTFIDSSPASGTNTYQIRLERESEFEVDVNQIAVLSGALNATVIQNQS